jgi:hypothetical protein
MLAYYAWNFLSVWNVLLSSIFFIFQLVLEIDLNTAFQKLACLGPSQVLGALAILS